MPQNPITPRPGGSASHLNITAATVIKATPGTVYRVVINAVATAGTFGVYDTTTTGSAALANAIFQATTGYPAVGTVLFLEFPCANGIVVNPGTGGNVSVSFA